MKTIRMAAWVTCVVFLAGVTSAQTVAIQQTMDYGDNDWLSGTWFVEPGAILDHYPFCRGSNQDWGWTHEITDSIPAGATGIESATLTIIAWKVDAEDGEDDVIYALPEEPLLSSTITREGSKLGLLKSYNESPITVPWSSDGQVFGYERLWSVTTFELPAEVLDDLWVNGQAYVHMDIDQTGWDGLRATVKSSTLRINYFAPQLAGPSTVAVHRFWSPLTSSHFYTMSEGEAQTLISEYAYAWTYEGIGYQALADDSDPDAMPVYRFWSPVAGGHFYTANKAEAESLLAFWQDVWAFEGIAFYAYPEGRQPVGTYPVYRFWSDLVSHHFYTMNEAEKDVLISEYSWAWTYEGVAWYAYQP
jgi:hypothetical protein